ncbi:actin-5c-related [Anaeramoeba flamelloides]|uniref:Actin-5c-related n=1 Tax=Anaeramoeba flamelloides TaxID=1746091 RepID=A0ABQ8YM84_9EUKA|nr:actin-5c-related [Anaeramoeba flamelloides]
MIEIYNHWENIKTPIVFDNGSYNVRVGFSGNEEPSAIFPTLVGRSKKNNTGMQENDLFIGDEAQERKAMLDLNAPIKNGIIENWDDMEKIWHHAFFNELRVDPSEHPVFLTEGVFNPKEKREKTMQLMYELFEVPDFYLKNTALLELMCHGYQYGTSISVGYNSTTLCYISEELIHRNTLTSFEIGGKDLTNFFQELLAFNTDFEADNYNEEDFREMKEKTSYYLEDPNKMIQKKDELEKGMMDQIKYELPDGKVLSLGRERFLVGELLFRPKKEILQTFGLVNSEQKKVKKNVIENGNVNLAKMVKEFILQKCPSELQNKMFQSMYLTGGSSYIKGFKERFHNELNGLWEENAPQIKLARSPETKYIAWQGGSTYSSIEKFYFQCTSRAEYEEEGPSLVHRKCKNFH